ncbi:hypothetical protein BPSY_2239 [Bifidobacterium psychraerophilum]|uniref:Uncharacterized protein n=1 Tax=Bifidobacterium psychraerophilum TaxID=218140 RepID=A0A087CNJ8_9BIFI|nr:hypothetical protein BPSY_2239 [Bifidobacterium psychraerophilum]
MPRCFFITLRSDPVWGPSGSTASDRHPSSETQLTGHYIRTKYTDRDRMFPLYKQPTRPNKS